MGIAGRLAGCIAASHDQSHVVHGVADILRARMLAIACGYEDADDRDPLRSPNRRRLSFTVRLD